MLTRSLCRVAFAGDALDLCRAAGQSADPLKRASSLPHASIRSVEMSAPRSHNHTKRKDKHMKHRLFVVLSGVLPVLLAVDAAPAQILDVARIGAVADSIAQAQIAGGAVPGITVAVAHDGEIVFERGYGQADVEMGVAAGPETVYGISSLTKQFSAALIMRLSEQGKISLDDPITKYLPDYPVQGHHVTVRHLLNHTSGTATISHVRDLPDPQWIRRDPTYEELVELFGTQPFRFEPGEKYEYNNFAYKLLGEIVKRVTGTPYAESVERDLLRPLGLEQTVYCDHRRVVPNRAESYEHDEGVLTHTRYISVHFLGPGGALCSTVSDLVRWTGLLHGGQVVSSESLHAMTAPTVLTNGDTIPRGYGLYLDDFGGHPKVYHGGTTPWGSFLAHYPEDELTVAVLTNSATVGRDKAEEMEGALARAALFRDLPVPADQVARYEGTYTYPSGESTAELRVSGEDGRLRVYTARGITPLLSQGDHVFVHGKDEDIRFIFIVENGRAESVTLHLGDQVIQGKRKP